MSFSRPHTHTYTHTHAYTQAAKNTRKRKRCSMNVNTASLQMSTHTCQCVIILSHLHLPPSSFWRHSSFSLRSPLRVSLSAELQTARSCISMLESHTAECPAPRCFCVFASCQRKGGGVGVGPRVDKVSLKIPVASRKQTNNPESSRG